jgi:septal ring factor EnvC (AmiA/AmiB activator)
MFGLRKQKAEEQISEIHHKLDAFQKTLQKDGLKPERLPTKLKELQTDFAALKEAQIFSKSAEIIYERFNQKAKVSSHLSVQPNSFCLKLTLLMMITLRKRNVVLFA